MWISHRKEIRKLTFRALALRRSESYRMEYLSNISLITASGFHQLWLKIHVRNMKSIIVCTTYRPPNTPLSYFDSDLTENFI